LTERGRRAQQEEDELGEELDGGHQH
jgi:hypothetical protein